MRIATRPRALEPWDCVSSGSGREGKGWGTIELEEGAEGEVAADGVGGGEGEAGDGGDEGRPVPVRQLRHQQAAQLAHHIRRLSTGRRRANMTTSHRVTYHSNQQLLSFEQSYAHRSRSTFDPF